MIQLTIPAPVEFISANDRMGWQKKARLTKEWRDAAQLWARHDKLPKDLKWVHIDVWLHFTTTRRRDPANYHPTAKAIVDGLVDYGLIADDDSTHLSGPLLYLGVGASGVPIGAVVLNIREEW